MLGTANNTRRLLTALSGALGRLRPGVEGRTLLQVLRLSGTAEPVLEPGPDGELPRVLALDAALARALRNTPVQVSRDAEQAQSQPPASRPHAVCLSFRPQDGDLNEVLLRTLSLVRPGGVVAVCTRRQASSRTQLSAALLHAGLGDLTQLRAGRYVLTAGRVPRSIESLDLDLPRPAEAQNPSSPSSDSPDSARATESATESATAPCAGELVSGTT